MAALQVGVKADEESLEALTKSIIGILSCNADQETLRHALTVLERTAGVNQVTISHCHVSGDRNISIDHNNNVTED